MLFYQDGVSFCTMLYLLFHSSVLWAADISISSMDSIQATINNASSGDVIVLAAGTYSECLTTTGKNLTFRGDTTANIKLMGLLVPQIRIHCIW